MMRTIAAGALALATLAGSAATASAQDGMSARPLTVTPRTVRRQTLVRPAAPLRAYSPYTGLKAIVTAPIALASTIVSIPFRVTDAAFAHTGGTPLTVIGTPIHYAGRIAQAPFRIVEAPFGGPEPFGETPNYY